MTKTVKGAAAVAKIAAAKVEAERKVLLGAYAATVGTAVTAANRAHVAVTDVMIAATLDLAANKVFKGAKPGDFDKYVRPVLKAALEPLLTVGAGSKAGYVTGCRNLWLAKANGIAPGTVQLTQAAWNSGMVAKLVAKGVLPKPVEGAPAKGRPNAIKAGQGAAAKGGQVASTGAASAPKVLTVEALQDMLRLAGMGDHTEALAHMVLNERPVLIKWLNAISK